MTALPSTHSCKAPFPARRSAPSLGFHVTFAGMLTCITLLLVGLAALNSEANLLFLLFGIGVGAVVFNAFAAVWMVRGIDVERVVPETVVAGHPFKIVYLVRSRRRWTSAWSLVISEVVARGSAAALSPGFITAIGPGRERRLELYGNCPRRGRVSLTAVRLLSRFPFGLFGCSTRIESAADVTVYPAIGRFRRDPWKDHRFSGSSPRGRDRGTGQDEFFGVREYREGDNPRWVHWRRSARTGELVVREMMPVRPTQLLILADPWPDGTSRSGLRDALLELDAETVISAAATAVCEGIERGHRVGLICRAAVPVVIPPAAGRPQRQRLLEELALISPGALQDLDRMISQIRWSSGWHARCLICSTQIGRVHEQVVRLLAGRAESIMCVSADSEAFKGLFDLSREPLLDRRPR